MAKKTPKIRFAALIRVSSEKQEKRGESLRTQDQQATDAARLLGGIIVARYAGQEHATAGWEREQLDKLLTDARRKSKPFDAVIVADPSRWSRDNVASETGLDVLRDNGIRFFVLVQEYDLYDPNQRVILGLQTTMNGYQAALNAQKSILNRIAKAKRGVVAVGSRPFGRHFNDAAGRWEVEPEKKAMIEEIAKRYVDGEGLVDLAKEFGMDRSNLHRTLTEKCGPKWPLKFASDRFNIRETIEVTIPPLLDHKTIKAVKKTAEANKTYRHGLSKHKHLFSRMLFCAHCDRAMSGQVAKGQRYYRHAPGCENCLGGFVRADDLEDVVIRHLFECFGNPKAVEKAIEEATPNRDTIKEYQQRQERIADGLAKLKEGRDRLIKFIVNGSITETQAEGQLQALTERETKLTAEAERLAEYLDKVPSPALAKSTAKRVSDAMRRFKPKGRKLVSARLWAKVSHANSALDKMTWEEKRELLQMVFGGKTVDGQRMGIYVERIQGQEGRQHRQWRYMIKGHLIDERGFFPMSVDRMEAQFFFGAAERQKELVTRVGRSNTPRSRTSTSSRSARDERRRAASRSAARAACAAVCLPAPASGRPSSCCSPRTRAHSSPRSRFHPATAAERGRWSVPRDPAEPRNTGT